MSEMNQHRPSPERRPRRRHDTSRTQDHSAGKTAHSQSHAGQGHSGAGEKKTKSRGAAIALRVGKVLGTLLLLGIVTGAFMACYAAVYIKSVIIPEATLDLSAYTLNENSVISYEKDGQLVELQTLVGAENRQWVDYEDIPQDLINAVVAVEDHRFYEHSGFDVIAICRAAWHDLTTLSLEQGGSTITQQLAKNLFLTQEKDFSRKVAEVFIALDLEAAYEKDQILELYVNTSYFGDGLTGVGAAARGYLGKEPTEMTERECALMAGLPNAPNALAADPERAWARAELVLAQMEKYGLS